MGLPVYFYALAVMEYDKVIKYLALRREAVLRQEYGDNIPADLAHPPVGPNNLDPATKAKQVELSDRILKILNKPNPRPQPSSASGLGGLSDLGGMGGMVGGVGGGDLQSAIENLIRTGPNLLASVQASTSGVITGFYYSRACDFRTNSQTSVA